MPGRVLLISINECDEPYPVFPLGLGHVDASLQAAGYVTEWIDVRLGSDGLERVVREFAPDYVGISIRNIDDVVIRRRETFYGPLTVICPSLRRLTKAPIILGGSGFSIFPEELLKLCEADFGICGEGERALVELLGALEQGGDYTGIPGLVHRDAGAVISNVRGGQPAQFLPATRPEIVARHYLDQSAMLNVQTQRGCSHRCCYCTYPLIEGRAWRRRDPEDVAEEMAALQERGAKYVFVVDSVFNSSRAHAGAVCEALLRRGVTIKWGCFLRPQGLTSELMSQMRAAGLSHIEFGSDSFSDEVLREYDKRLTFDDILESNELAQRAGIEFCHFLICGGPGESPETMEETFLNSKRLTGAVVMALVGMRVYPGTSLHQRALRENVFRPETDFLAPQYYVSPKVGEAGAFKMLAEFSRRSPNWIVGDPSPAYVKMAQRLRSRGVVGPLWGYFATMQRLALDNMAQYTTKPG